MTENSKPTQEQAERFCELLAELNAHPLMGQFSPLSDHVHEACRDLVEDDLKRNVESDALRANKSRIAATLTASEPNDEGAEAGATISDGKAALRETGELLSWLAGHLLPEAQTGKGLKKEWKAVIRAYDSGSLYELAYLLERLRELRQAFTSKVLATFPENNTLVQTRALFARYELEPDVSIPIQRILHAREDCGDSKSIEYKRELLADAIATVISSDDTPEGVRAAIVTWIKDLRGRTIEDDLWPDNLRESFAGYLNEIDKQGEPMTSEQAEGITDALARLFTFADVLPAEIYNPLAEALTNIGVNGNASDPVSPDLLRVWLPKHLRQEKAN